MVLLVGYKIIFQSKEFKLCRGMATALGSIIRLSFNRDFREKCFKLLEVKFTYNTFTNKINTSEVFSA